MGTKVLTKTQYGLETTHGTAVAADTMLLMRCVLPDTDRQIKIPEVDIGVRSNMLLDYAFAQKVLAEGIALEDADGAYFQMFPLIFNMGIKAGTGTEQSAGQTDYLWTYAAPQTASETVSSVTLEVGDETMQYEVSYCMARTIKISGDCESGECHVSADVFGGRIIQTTITGSLAVPTAEFVNAKLARLYIDNTWAGLGATEIAAALVNFDITINTGVHPKFLGSASRLFGSHGQGAISGTATFTLERTAAVAAEELLFRPASTYTATERFARLRITGNQIGTGNLSTLTVDMAGVYTAWKPLGSDREGNSLDVVTLTFGYDSTGGQGLSCSVITNVTAV